MNKLILAIVSTVGVPLLGICATDEVKKETKIIIDDKNCNRDNSLCALELVKAKVGKYTDSQGKTVEKVLSEKPLHNWSGNITWTKSKPAEWAPSEAVAYAFSDIKCPDSGCTESSNPTAVFLPVTSNKYSVNIGVSGTITVDGKTYDLKDVSPIKLDRDPSKGSEVGVINIKNPGDYVAGRTVSDLVKVANTGLNLWPSDVRRVIDMGNSNVMVVCEPNHYLPVNYPASGSEETFNNEKMQGLDEVILLNDGSFNKRLAFASKAYNGIGRNSAPTWDFVCI
ncbi:MAG: DUF3281 family protein [Francisella sp.]